MKGNFESLAVMLGKSPVKPKEISEEAQKIHFYKKTLKKTPDEIAHLKEELENIKQGRYSTKWRNRRWIILLSINLLFPLSFWLDIQLFEGSMIASRVFGFHMADIYSATQVGLAYHNFYINLLIGTITVLIFWAILGGRSFCSWACPYHFLAEIAEKLYLKITKKSWSSSCSFHRSTRTIFFFLFIALAIFTGYGVFMAINPVGIVSRALIYGVGWTMVWVFILFLFEVFFVRRAWCRYVCPMGLTYGLIGSLSPTQITYHLADCQHEAACHHVCEVPHVLECVKKGRSRNVTMDIGTDCTLCGACVDICPTGSLRFEIKGLSKLL